MTATKRYLVVPAEPPPLEPVERRAGAQLRSAVMSELTMRAGAQFDLGALRSWVDDRPSARLVNREPHAPDGSSVVRMTPSAAADLAGRMPHLQVVEDVQLDGPPAATLLGATGATPAAPAAVPWHLERIGLAPRPATADAPTGRGVTVAVFDSGVDARHPELDDRVTGEWRQDASGTIVAVKKPKDSGGHGTGVASLIAGRTLGVAPGAAVLSLRTTEAQRVWLGDLLVGWMGWLARSGSVDVLNLSVGLPLDEFDPTQLLALGRQVDVLASVGILTVASIGNDGPNELRAPGAVPGVLGVGATNRDDRVWSASGGGRRAVGGVDYDGPDVVAPGVLLTTAAPGGTYREWTGTSQAAPIVAGLAALALEAAPQLSVAELRRALVARCASLRGVPKARQGAGRVRA